MAPALVALTALGCPSPFEFSPPAEYVIPEGAVRGLYDPFERLTTWPDDMQTVVDDGTATGRRVQLRPNARVDLAAQIPETIQLLDALESLDGFGTTAGITLHFTEDVDPATFFPRLLRFPGGTEVAVETTWTDSTRVPIVEPLVPLEPATTYALVVDDRLRDLDGERVWRAYGLHDQLFGSPTDADMRHAYEGWTKAARHVDPERIVAGTVFTTQDVFGQDDAVAALLAETSPTFVPSPCVPEATITTCTVTLDVQHALGDDLRLDPADPVVLDGSYTLSVDIHLPGDGTDGPYPVVMYGHGLAGDRGEGRGTARQLADLGVAVVAVDAPFHGDHPTTVNSADLFWVLDFFGIIATEAGMDVRQLRDNWRLATWDKLQIAQAIRAGVDLTGDGVDDLDGTQLHWTGHSLGGIMGVSLVAQDLGIASAHLSVPGGRVSNIVHRGGTFAPLIALMAPPGTSTAEVDRFFPLLQTAIERGEPANWATRMDHADVFATYVLDDDIIPNSSGRFMLRALGLTHVGPELEALDALPHDPVLPHVGADRTAAAYQFDEMVDDGVRVDATHSHVYDSDSHQLQLRRWLETMLEGGPGEVVDPF